MFIVNLISFNLVWFGLVYWGNAFIPVAAAFFCWHLYYTRNNDFIEIRLIFIVATIGVFIDSALHYLGVFIFTENNHLPFWLITLWLCFATTLSHSLRFLDHSKIFQGLIGAIVAPLSYMAGQQFDAVKFSLSFINTYLLLAIIWGLLMMLFFHIKDILIKTEIGYV